jgi:Asp-tRNA(Asn)/Glu-tRNA(Gln) amidotransferase A subunit family amidase
MCGGYADRRIDDSEIFKGAPVGLQVMCRRLQEEKVLDLVECITSALARFRP